VFLACPISPLEHIELPAKQLDYFLRRNKSNINQKPSDVSFCSKRSRELLFMYLPPLHLFKILKTLQDWDWLCHPSYWAPGSYVHDRGVLRRDITSSERKIDHDTSTSPVHRSQRQTRMNTFCVSLAFERSLSMAVAPVCKVDVCEVNWVVYR